MNRRVLAIGGGLLFPVALSGQALESPRFGNPPADVRPALLWVWNSRITDSLISRQLADMRRAGLTEVIIVPADTGGLDWAARIAHAQHEAQRTGIQIRLSGSAGTVRVVGDQGWSQTPEQLRAQIGAHVSRGSAGPGPLALHGYWADPTNPLQVALPDVVTWTARVTDLSLGRSAAKMALLLQTRDSAFARLVARLEQLQGIFDIVSEEALGNGGPGAGELHVGTQAYHVVVVPPTPTLSTTAAARLVALSRSGGTVIAWRPLPAVAAAWPDTGPRFHLLDSLAQLDATLMRTPWSGVREPGPPALRIRALERGEDRVFVLFNESDRRIAIAPTFRMIGQPELWNPDDGSMRLAPTRWSPRFAVTDVPIELEPFQVVGIVFRARPRPPRGPIGPPAVERPIAEAAPTWRFRFAAGAMTTHEGPLGSWTTLDSTYSGTGVYEGTIEVPATMRGAGDRLLLDLGQVRDVADVELNDTPLGRRLWRPYRYDVTTILRSGTNRIMVRVTNTLANQKGTPLPSGLLGPVRVLLVSGTR